MHIDRRDAMVNRFIMVSERPLTEKDKPEKINWLSDIWHLAFQSSSAGTHVNHIFLLFYSRVTKGRTCMEVSSNARGQKYRLRIHLYTAMVLRHDRATLSIYCVAPIISEN